MDSKKKGIVTEIETMLAFVRLGYPVLIPYGDNERYDYIVDVDGKFVKIQCKSAHTINNGESFMFDTRSATRNSEGNDHHIYTADEVDYFATAYNGQCYLIPVGVYTASAKLRLIPGKNGHSYGAAWAKDYELEKIVKTW